MTSSPPDFYATDEQREELLAEIEKSKAKIFNKRLACKDYCAKLLDHIQLMRGDLLCLDNNEDAIAIHEEMKGITDCMEVFGIGLDQSVTNEPTGIDLADWANLCLFRLAIARRRISTIKIYVDKTGSVEALYKIEAYLYYSYEFLNTGELDEYENEMIEQDEFWNIGFLLSHSSIADPLKHPQDDDESESAPEPMKESDSESETETETETETEESEKEPSKAAEVKEEQTKNDEPSKGDVEEESKEETSTGAVDAKSTEETKGDSTKEDSTKEVGTKEDSTKETETKEDSTKEVETKEDSTKEVETKMVETKEKKTKDKEAKTELKPKRTPKKKRRREKGIHSCDERGGRTPKRRKKKKRRPKTESDSNSSFEGKLPKKTGTTDDDHFKATKAPSTPSPSGGFKLRFGTLGRKKKKSIIPDSEAQEVQTSRTKLTDLFSLNREKSKPLSARDPHKERRSLSAFGRKKISEPSMETPLVRGEVYVCKGNSAKKRWAVLNVELLEIYRDNECLHLSKAFKVANFQKVELEYEESKKKKYSYLLSLDSHDGSITLGLQNREDQLEWAIGLCWVAREGTGGTLLENLDKLVSELYTNEDESIPISYEEEEWTLDAGTTLTQIGNSTTYNWNGTKLTSNEDEDEMFNEITWDGHNLTINRNDTHDITFKWIPCAHEFRSQIDPRSDSSAVVWNWSEEEFVQFLPVTPGEEPKLWVYKKPVPPPVIMCVEILSLLAQKKPLVPRVQRLRGSSIRERTEERKKKKRTKRKKPTDS